MIKEKETTNLRKTKDVHGKDGADIEGLTKTWYLKQWISTVQDSFSDDDLIISLWL